MIDFRTNKDELVRLSFDWTRTVGAWSSELCSLSVTGRWPLGNREVNGDLFLLPIGRKRREGEEVVLSLNMVRWPFKWILQATIELGAMGAFELKGMSTKLVVPSLEVEQMKERLKGLLSEEQRERVEVVGEE
ncbi:hypothetical protein BDY24DRAFT_402785 [Mrakia frigida]|uniref:uncharacterized protein n=1 Tax=Mrakia frigida TaxID=29902 RepID=UPI003FCC0A86